MKPIRLISIVVFALCCRFSAFAQNITVKSYGGTIESVLISIERQTDYHFIYDKGAVDVLSPTNIDVRDADLDKVLSSLFAGKDISYVIKDRKIILSRRQENAVAPSASGKVTVSGTISDTKGEPLIGVVVVAAGTNNGVISDIDGSYSITVEKGSVINFSLIGFKSRDIEAVESQSVDVVLPEDMMLLDEVVVVGYGIQKKSNLTGALSTVDFEQEMSSRPVQNASSALAGLSAGVQVQQTSGQPGSNGATILVRGTGTLNSSSPLVLVDGIEWDMNNVNTDDISSITVLKDAASAAIYGSRAANGVILVTTKKGKGQTKVNYSFIGSLDSAQNKLALVGDYARHMELLNEGAENLDSPEIFSQSTIDLWKYAKAHPEELNEYGVKNKIAYPNTDWFNEVIGKGFSQKHNLSVQGSSDRTNYFISLGYVDNQGIMNQHGMDSGQQRLTFRSNAEYKAFDWLSVGVRLHGVWQNTGLTDVARGFEYLSQTPPGIYPGENDKWGLPASTEENQNCASVFYQMGRWGKDEMFRGNFSAYTIIRPVKGLSVEATYNYSPDFGLYATWGQPNGTWDYVKDVRINESSLDVASIYNKSFNRVRRNSEILARYHNTFGEDHDLNLLAGFTTSYYYDGDFNIYKKGMTDWSLHTLSTAKEVTSATSTDTDWSLMSWFGRANYAWKSKYLFEANLRVDGSSRFSPESRWGFFPSFSAGWVLTKEEFMESLSGVVSNLKLRASWGKLGNNASGNYDWQATYTTFKTVIDDKTSTGLAITKLGNTALEWESTTTANLGVDFGFFENRLSGELDIYKKLTTGILFTPSIPITMGNVTGATENVAEVSNRGLELSLSWQDTVGDFYYKVGGNVSFNTNRVDKYLGTLERYWIYDEDGFPESFYSNYGDVAQSGFGGLILEGRMLGELYVRNLYHGNGSYSGGRPGINEGPVDGMIRTESDMEWVRAMIASGYKFSGGSTISKDQLWYGDLIYEDANGDKNFGDTNDLNLTGKSKLPKYNFGFNVSAAWKGLDFYMLWSGAAGFTLYWNHAQYNGTQTKNGYAVSQRIADDHYFYDPENPSDPRTNINASYPRLTDQTQRNNSASSTFWMYKGDYLKLKNLQIGYTLPKQMTSKLLISKFRVYLSGENLLTLTQFPGLDPEIGTAVTYPLIRQYAIGAQITF